MDNKWLHYIDIEAHHIRKGMFFNPDPYVKIRIEPEQEAAGQPILAHHYKDTRTSVCENTTEPRWKHEVTYNSMSSKLAYFSILAVGLHVSNCVEYVFCVG